MKVLVTGGAGFIGSHVVEKLLAEGCTVAVVDDLSTGEQSNLSAAVTFYALDIRSPQLAEVLLTEQPHAVIHLAAQVSVKRSVLDPQTDADINICGTLNLLKAVTAAGVGQVVYGSTAAVYGNPAELPLREDSSLQPLSPYGVSKRAAEDYLMAESLNNRLRVIALRYANVYGPRQALSAESGVTTIFLNAALRRENPTFFGDGTATRDYVYVADVADATWRALNCKDTAVLNVSSGVEVSVKELWQTICSVSGVDLAPIEADVRPGDILKSSLCPHRAHSLLDWQASTSLVSGLRKTIEYYQGTSHVQV
jgi:UDP-glucose 4-epimerase